MTNVQARLRKLESMAAGVSKPGRVFRVLGGSAEADPWAFLLASGHQVDETADTVIRRILVSPSSGGPVVADQPMMLSGM